MLYPGFFKIRWVCGMVEETVPVRKHRRKNPLPAEMAQGRQPGHQAPSRTHGFTSLTISSKGQKALHWPVQLSTVQSLSRIRLFATPWTAAGQAFLSITNSWSLLKLMSIESVMPSNHHTLCHPLLLLPSIFPSIRVFSNESILHIRWPKYWSFNFNMSPSNEHPGLSSFRMNWLDPLSAQGTLKSLLQHHSSKASILQCSAFFIIQLSHPYMTTGKWLLELTLRVTQKCHICL